MKQSIKAILAVLLSTSLLLPATGCRQSDKQKIGIAMPAKSLERWNRDGEYLRKALEAEGYDVELRFSDNNIDQQINDVQVLIADDVDVLIIAAIDGSTLFRTLEDAQIKNIPVIAYDRLIMNTETVDCYVSFDNYTVGVLQAQFLADALDIEHSTQPYNLELVAGDAADNNAVYFFNGAMEVIKPLLDAGKFRIPSGKVTFEQTATPGWSTDLAYENMQNTLASYYAKGERLDAVLASSDVLSFGAAQALSSDYAGGNVPLLTGQDGDIAALHNIVDGKQTMTIYKNTNDQASVTVEVTKAILDGRALDASLTDSFSAPCVFDTNSYNNGKINVTSYLLTPDVITADNLDTLVDTGAYQWDANHKYLISSD